MSAYTQEELETFIRCWQTSSTVAEAVTRLTEDTRFRDNYLSPGWYCESEWKPLNISWAQQRASALRREGVKLKSLPSIAPKAEGPDYRALKRLAASLC
jgi:hypothetical protein